MSTLEVACGRCDKRFRVRAEFAGRSTRCPGCSAPITIAGAPRAAPARPVEEDRPRPRPRPRDDEDDAPRRPDANWAPVDAALRREQVALIFAFLTVLAGMFLVCAGRSFNGPMDWEMMWVCAVIPIAAPTLATAGFGVLARVSALSAPAESRSRGSAAASLLCALSGVASLLGFALALYYAIDSHGPDDFPVAVCLGGVFLGALAAIGTFAGFVAQVGIARRSAAVARGLGAMAGTAAVCTVVPAGLGLLFALIVGATTPTVGYGYHQDHSAFGGILMILLLIELAVMLVLYHRLLAAGRRAVGVEPAARYQD